MSGLDLRGAFSWWPATETRDSQSPATMTARPSIPASLLAVGAALTTLWLLGIDIVPVLATVVVALGLVAAGLALKRRGTALTGTILAVVGAVTSLVAIALAVAESNGLGELLWVLAGVLGVTLLGFALVPVRGSGTRWLVKAGAGGVFLAVLVAGLFRDATFGSLLLAMVGTVLAWDAGEHAIDVGRQLGRTTSTWRLDLAHVGATAAVGLGGVLAAHVAAGIRTGGLSLSAYAVLFVALVALTLALHR